MPIPKFKICTDLWWVRNERVLISDFELNYIDEVVIIVTDFTNISKLAVNFLRQFIPQKPLWLIGIRRRFCDALLSLLHSQSLVLSLVSSILFLAQTSTVKLAAGFLVNFLRVKYKVASFNKVSSVHYENLCALSFVIIIIFMLILDSLLKISKSFAIMAWRVVYVCTMYISHTYIEINLWFMTLNIHNYNHLKEIPFSYERTAFQLLRG